MSLNLAHATHRESLWRFLLLVMVLVAYFAAMSWKYDAATGAWLAALSWSFFVLCTPVADGGFLIAFPVRLLFGTRMIWTQVAVWAVAVAINVVALSVAPDAYDDTALTGLLRTILLEPWPNWSILALSAVGTGLSIWFGDEMMDVTAHAQRQKQHRHGFTHKVIATVALGVLTILAYYHLLRDLGIEMPGA
ncbi:hypothetical protein R5H30_00820 [Sulfitobacter sp. D35]|uniref:hypothetical protein n=1 Tax=Sulfitobacter sp. D35 TaxID=3083252 RepID=UPI00296EE256|nr:hypothetical protein [Sulfitobacter sp. D35]MDW4496507.1 hypothetical protein [Sulfitobacter sp. D35]